jgi:hypothetical protein
VATATVSSFWRKRRGSVTHRRYGNGYTVIAEAPKLELGGRSDRAKTAAPRPPIDDVTRERIQRLSADGWSLRRIGAEVEMSHESVRAVLAAATLPVER